MQQILLAVVVVTLKRVENAIIHIHLILKAPKSQLSLFLSLCFFLLGSKILSEQVNQAK